MLRAYKVEIHPSNDQIRKINSAMGICRWLYNTYLAENQKRFKKFQDGLIPREDAFISANHFDKYINNEIKVLDEFAWINTCGSKARKKSICDAEIAYKRFFKGLSGFPRFKKKHKSRIGLYFPKNNKTDWEINRHKVKIPTLKWVRLKEFGYIPPNANVINGTITKQANKYYVSIVCDIPEKSNPKINLGQPLGIDLGITTLAIYSDGTIIKNINKSNTVRKLEKCLKREQIRLSRKYESLKKTEPQQERRATRQNIQKQVIKVQRLYQRLANIRTDYINKTISDIIRQKPSWITIEDLNVSGMMKNRHLSKAISQQKFYEFRVKLTTKCSQNNIELRIVDRWYPSSKTCSCCGHIKKNLKLSDRTYHCDNCGFVINRDLNASINLKDVETYKIA